VETDHILYTLARASSLYVILSQRFDCSWQQILSDAMIKCGIYCWRCLSVCLSRPGIVSKRLNIVEIHSLSDGTNILRQWPFSVLQMMFGELKKQTETLYWYSRFYGDNSTLQIRTHPNIYLLIIKAVDS